MSMKNITGKLKSKETWKKVGWGALGLVGSSIASNAAKTHISQDGIISNLIGGGATTVLAYALGKDDAATGSLIGTTGGVVTGLMAKAKQ